MPHPACRYPIDLDMAAEFLRFLDPDDRGSVFLFLNNRPDVHEDQRRFQRYWRRDQYLRALPGLHDKAYQPFVGINAPREPRATRKNEDIGTFRAYFIDFDGVESKRAKDIYPPDVVVRSKRGEHWYWHGICAASRPHPEAWPIQMDVLALEFGGDPQVCDPARVMRMPGACHLKDLSDPYFVHILEHRSPPERFTDRGDLIMRAHGIDMAAYWANPPKARAKAHGDWAGGTAWPEHVIDFFRKLKTEGVKYEPNGNAVGEWIAPCPLRNHKTARVVIKLRDNGEIYCFCQAAGKHNCTGDDILNAWGLAWGERLPPGWKSQWELGGRQGPAPEQRSHTHIDGLETAQPTSAGTHS